MRDILVYVAMGAGVLSLVNVPVHLVFILSGTSAGDCAAALVPALILVSIVAGVVGAIKNEGTRRRLAVIGAAMGGLAVLFWVGLGLAFVFGFAYVAENSG